MMIFEANSTPIVWELSTRPVGGQQGKRGGEGTRDDAFTFVFDEAVEEA